VPGQLLALLFVVHIPAQALHHIQLGWGLAVAAVSAFAVPVRAVEATPPVAIPAPTSNPPRSTLRLFMLSTFCTFEFAATRTAGFF
jgi:hypothetical protein